MIKFHLKDILIKFNSVYRFRAFDFIRDRQTTFQAITRFIGFLYLNITSNAQD